MFRSKFVLVILALFTATAFAEGEGSPWEDNVLGTLHYRAAQGHGYGSLGLSDEAHEGESVTVNGVGTDAYTRTSWQTTATGTYAFTDYLQASISESVNFGTGTNRTRLPSGQQLAYTSNGFSDPTLNVNYRYWGGLTGTHFGSVYLAATPAIGRQQNAESNSTGNNLAASTEVTLGTNLYWVMGSSEFEVAPQINYFDAGVYNDTNPLNSDSFTSYWRYSVAGYYRFHFGPKYWAQASADLIGPYKVNYTFDNRNPVFTEQSSIPYHVEPSLSFGYKPCERFIVALNWTYDGYSLQTTPTSAPGSISTSSYDVDTFTLTATATW